MADLRIQKKIPTRPEFTREFLENPNLRGTKGLSKAVVRGEGPEKTEAQECVRLQSGLNRASGEHDVPAALDFGHLKLAEALREHQEAEDNFECILEGTKQDLARVAEEKGTALQDATMARESLAQKVADLEEANARLGEKELELSTAQTQAENAARELGTLGEELDTAKTRIEELSAQVTALNQSLAQAGLSNSAELAAARNQAAEANGENKALREQVDGLTLDLAAETARTGELSDQVERTLALALGDTDYFNGIEQAMVPINNLLFGQRNKADADLSRLLPFVNVLVGLIPGHGEQLYNTAASILQKTSLTPAQQIEEIIDAFTDYLSVNAGKSDVVEKMLYAFLPNN